jgi:hypothetical protein
MARPLRSGVYAYPWDLADIGSDVALAEMKAAGMSSLNLACTYHPIATFSPRAGARRMLYQELGGVFFPAREARYGRIKPATWSDADVLAAWAAAFASVEAASRMPEAMGVDVTGLRSAVVKEIDRSLAAVGEVDPTGSFEERHGEWLTSRPDYAAFIEVRDQAVVSLLIAISEAVRSESPSTSLNVWTLKDVNLPLVLDRIRGITFGHATRLEDVRTFKESVANEEDLDIQYLLLMSSEHGLESQKVRSEMRAVAGLPVDQISLYNYGLLRRGQLELFAQQMDLLARDGSREDRQLGRPGW